MRIYVKNIPAKLYSDPIWNDGFRRSTSSTKNND